MSENNFLGHEFIRAASAESVNDLFNNVISTVTAFNYPVRFAVEAWKWNPMDIKCYQVVFTTLKEMEDIVALLQKNVEKVDVEIYLKELVLREPLIKKMPSYLGDIFRPI